MLSIVWAINVFSKYKTHHLSCIDQVNRGNEDIIIFPLHLNDDHWCLLVCLYVVIDDKMNSLVVFIFYHEYGKYVSH